MNIFLISHPEVYNPNNVCFGQSELPLSENFTSDFSWIADHLSALNRETSICFSSPLRRCLKLANFLWNNDDFVIDKKINDINFGNWEMKEWTQIPSLQLNKWSEDFVNYKMPKGESLSQAFERVNTFYQEILLLKKENIIIVTHPNIIKCFLCNVTGLSLQNTLDFEISNSSISKIFFDSELYKDKVIYTNYSPFM